MESVNKKFFRANIAKTGKQSISLSVDIFNYLEDGLFYTYCPSLDLIAYGETEDISQSEFSQILAEHFEWCMDNNTVEADLAAHGWRKEQEEMEQPPVTAMLMNNDLLRDIVNHKNYRKHSVKMHNSKVVYA